HNPGSSELLFEMGRIAFEARHDNVRAQRLWQRGIDGWNRLEKGKAEPDYFMERQLLEYLSLAEEEQGQFAQAYQHLIAASQAPGGKGLYEIRLQRLREHL